MNEGAGDGRGIRYTKNNDILWLNQISDDEEKGCRTVGTAHAVSCAKNNVLWNCVKNI